MAGDTRDPSKRGLEGGDGAVAPRRRIAELDRLADAVDQPPLNGGAADGGPEGLDPVLDAVARGGQLARGVEGVELVLITGHRVTGAGDKVERHQSPNLTPIFSNATLRIVRVRAPSPRKCGAWLQ